MATTSPEPGLQTTRPTGGIQSVDTSDIKPADRPSEPAEYGISFGPFRLLPTQRLLLEGDKQLRIGSRALDLLVALVERPGELVSKPELIAKVRPHTFVDESNLKAHILALRRALAYGEGGNRYVATVPRRGYCFVAPVAQSAGSRRAITQHSGSEPFSNIKFTPRQPADRLRDAGPVQAMPPELSPRQLFSVGSTDFSEVFTPYSGLTSRHSLAYVERGPGNNRTPSSTRVSLTGGQANGDDRFF